MNAIAKGIPTRSQIARFRVSFNDGVLPPLADAVAASPTNMDDNLPGTDEVIFGLVDVPDVVIVDAVAVVLVAEVTVEVVVGSGKWKPSPTPTVTNLAFASLQHEVVALSEQQ